MSDCQALHPDPENEDEDQMGEGEVSSNFTMNSSASEFLIFGQIELLLDLEYKSWVFSLKL